MLKKNVLKLIYTTYYCNKQLKIETKTLNITATDKLTLVASYVKNRKEKPFVLFCHQEEMNKFEFSGIAKTFNELGFNTCAVDLRFGGSLAKEISETKENAIENEKSTDEHLGFDDLNVVVDYLKKKYNKKVVLFGSGISASLILYVATKNKNVAAAIAFSPSDYFAEKLGSLKQVCAKIKVPTFITGEKSKSQQRSELFWNLMHEDFMHYEPINEGMYGAQILWKYKKDNKEFWDALLNFVERIKKKRFY